MPKASAPNAPCVAVWLSPQTMVMPGWVKPCSGPDDMARCPGEYRPCRNRHAEFLDVALQQLDLNAAFRIVDAVRAVGGRHVVVGDGDCRVGPMHLAPGERAAPRRPAGWSPHGSDGGRYRAGRCRPAACPPDDCPRSCRTASVAWPFQNLRSSYSFLRLVGGGRGGGLAAGARPYSRARSWMRAFFPVRPRR